MSEKVKATPAATGHGLRMSDQLSGSISSEHTHIPSRNQRPQSETGSELRHYCRNLKCRSKLPAPIENVRKAFCCRGGHSAFYRTRCLVCETDIRTDPLTGKKRKWSSRKFCGRKCNAEARRFPHVYAWGLPDPVRRTSDLRSAHSTRLISALANDRGWRWWGGDGDGDHSLYDRDGLTIARVVLEDGGRYHLRTPVTIPRQAWASLDEARRGAESFALMAMPLAGVDRKLAARIKRDNETPHPMGQPLNRPPLTNDATLSNWRPARGGAGVPDIPQFLRRGAS